MSAEALNALSYRILGAAYAGYMLSLGLGCSKVFTRRVWRRSWSISDFGLRFKFLFPLFIKGPRSPRSAIASTFL